MNEPKQFDFVIVVDNETGEEWDGMILKYTPDTITIRTIESFKTGSLRHEIKRQIFDATKVHFKGESE